MATESISSALGAATAGNTAATAASRTTLGSEQFLTLMISQLKNQDPFKPMDPTQYVSQLAEFSSVSGISEMNASIGTLTEAMRGTQVLGGSNLIGREILADASEVALGASGSVRGSTDVPAGASAALLLVTDATGQVVRRQSLAALEGTTEFEWDGRSDQGERAPPGSYTLSTVATVGGETEQLVTSLVSKVGSVTIDPTTHKLTLNTAIGPVALGNVRRVM